MTGSTGSAPSPDRPEDRATGAGLTGGDQAVARRRSIFHHLLADTLGVSVTHCTVWFAVTFFVYLETRSVFATGVISGVYSGRRPAPPAG